MSSHRVLLISSQHLFSEGIEEVLRGTKEVELIGPWKLNEDICTRIGEVQPHVAMVVDEDPRSQESARLTTAIIGQYPELPVIRAILTENVFRVLPTHLLLARSADPLETICNLPANKSSNERSK